MLVRHKITNYPEEAVITFAMNLSSDVNLVAKYFVDKFMQADHTWRVKLVITHLDINYFIRGLGHLLKTARPSSFKFGTVHTGLQVGYYLFDWNDSSLCIPQIYEGNERTLMALDLEFFDDMSVKKEKAKAVAEVVARYNTTRQYHPIYCNCQHFVDDLLKALEINPVFEGELGEFMKQLENTVSPDQVIATYKGKKFETHADLDNFVLELQSDGQFHPNNYRLLKAYDRIFWMKLMALKQKEKLTPADHILLKKCEATNCCPFGDPVAQGTLLGSANTITTEETSTGNQEAICLLI